MAEALVGGGRATAATLGAFSVFGGFLSSSFGVTEANVARISRVAGTFDRFAGSLDANGTGRSLQFRKNSGNGNEVVSFTDSTAQVVYDSTHSDAVTATDTYDIKYTGAGTAFIPYWAKSVFQASVGHVTPIYTLGGTIGTSTTFISFRTSASNATEAPVQWLLRVGATFANMWTCVTTSAAGTITARLRINAANGTLVIVTTAATTGVFEDTTHSDATVVADKIDVSVISSSGSPVMSSVGVIGTWGAVANDIIGGDSGATYTFNASTQFSGLLSSGVMLTTEAPMKMQHGFGGVAKNFRVDMGTNSLTGTLTCKVRKNGADATGVVTFATTVTGYAEDVTHTDPFLPTDDMNYSWSGGTSGTASFAVVAMTETPQAPFVPPVDCSWQIPVETNRPMLVAYQ